MSRRPFRLRVSEHALGRYQERVDPRATSGDVELACVLGVAVPAGALAASRAGIGVGRRGDLHVLTPCGRAAMVIREDGVVATVLLVPAEVARVFLGRPEVGA